MHENENTFLQEGTMTRGTSLTVTSLYYFTGAQLLERVCVVPVYLIWWARVTSSAHAPSAKRERTSNMNANELIDARTRAHEADNKVKLGALPGRADWCSPKKRTKKIPFCIYATLNFPFSITIRIRCNAYVSLVTYIFLFFSRRIRRCECYTLTKHLPRSMQTLLTVCYRCFRNKIRCAIFLFFIRNGLHFILFSYIFDANGKKIINVAVRALHSRSVRHGIVDIHLIFYTRWIFHPISFHFMSFDIM